ncbi:hypothetical protein [Aurantimonas sp. VKM B-3413]|uniref:hypothetical protein n=1 Tax=Aurantimonas sp. VKM B-3413 TaxID=2779401 RepID=UPI001E37F0DA|nr:hypothetical protein [Aurantimonas sp. VKM B-3413]MCB8838420.1 hypothetical protein [Aurantimonas sp. VKM B-3413]
MPAIRPLAIAALAAILLPVVAFAGDFRLGREHYSHSRFEPLITFSGVVTKGDRDKLAALIKQICAGKDCDIENVSAIVSFDSPGGSFSEGIALAEAIREANVATVVEDGKVCLSACALAWLGGSGFHATGGVGTYIDRTIEPGARIGFHSPYISAQAMAALAPEERLGIQANGLRTGISALVRFLTVFGVAPQVIDRIVGMGPDQVMSLDTIADLVAFRAEFPPAPVETLGLGREAITWNVCTKLIALYYNMSLADPNNLERRYGEADSKAEAGETYLGYRVDDRPLNTSFCGALASEAIPSPQFSISVARMAWKADVSDTFTQPFVHFVFAQDGWNQAGYNGGQAAQSTLRLTPMLSWLLPNEMRIADLPQAARLAMRNDKAGIALPSQPSPSEPSEPSEPAAVERPSEPVSTLLSRFSAALVSDADPLQNAVGRRTYRFGDLDVEVEVGAPALLDAEAARRDAEPRGRITYRKEFADAFVYSGLEADRRSGYYNLALGDSDAAAIVRMHFPVGRDGRASPAAQKAIGRIACTARFGQAGLPCAKK